MPEGLSEDKCWSLSRAGIGKRYHNKSLKDYGDKGVELLEWAKENHQAVITEGLSLRIVGLSSRSATMMAARTFHLSGGAGVYVTDLVKLLEVHNNPDNDAYRDAHLLCVNGFDRSGDCPLNARSRSEVEAIICNRFDDRRPVFFGIPVKNTGSSNWWSEEMYSELHKTELMDVGSHF